MQADFNYSEFLAICKSGQPKIVADWLEDHDDEYLTTIAEQLRRQHGEWLLGVLEAKNSFKCLMCKDSLGYGYIFILSGSHRLPKPYAYLFCCHDCRDDHATLYNKRDKLVVKSL